MNAINEQIKFMNMLRASINLLDIDDAIKVALFISPIIKCDSLTKQAKIVGESIGSVVIID